MTQKQVGDAVGISDVAVRQYELFKRKPKDEILRKIAKALNVKFSYLKEAHYPYTRDEIFNILVKYVLEMRICRKCLRKSYKS